MVNEKDREWGVCQDIWKAQKSMFVEKKKDPCTTINGSCQLLSTYFVQYLLLSVLYILAHLVLIINIIKLLLLQLFGRGH